MSTLKNRLRSSASRIVVFHRGKVLSPPALRSKAQGKPPAIPPMQKAILQAIAIDRLQRGESLRPVFSYILARHIMAARAAR